MRLRPLLALALALVGAGVCMRLGLWQLSRLAEKRAANAALREAFAAPPVVVEDALPPPSEVEGHRMMLTGRFDGRAHILLRGRERNGEPGVLVVTRFLPERGGVGVLVERGWMPAPDAATARPQDHPESGTRVVLGVARLIGRDRGGAPWRRLETLPDSVTLWSARSLDPDSLRTRVPGPLAPYVVTELPGEGVPAVPVRAAPPPLDEFTHWNYAFQWFLFGSILLLGPVLLAWQRRRSSPPPAPSGPAPPRS